MVILQKRLQTTAVVAFCNIQQFALKRKRSGGGMVSIRATDIWFMCLKYRYNARPAHRAVELLVKRSTAWDTLSG
jgi:hypothetical protein